MHDDKPDRGGQTHRLRQPRLGGAPVISDANGGRAGARVTVRTVAFGRTACAAVPGQDHGCADRAGAGPRRF